jgi:hypothetical protein
MSMLKRTAPLRTSRTVKLFRVSIPLLDLRHLFQCGSQRDVRQITRELRIITISEMQI